MLNYRFDRLAEIVAGHCLSQPEEMIREIFIDSRHIPLNRPALFVAIIGQRHDGHNFIDELWQSGIRYFVVSSLPKSFSDKKEAHFIVVEDTLQAFQQLAAYHRQQYNIPLVAITGSNGKTTVKEWLYHCLRGDYRVVRSPKSYNSQVGVPLSLFLLGNELKKSDKPLALLEAGISQPGEMAKLEAMLQPTVGLFTMIGDAHQENFSSLQEKVVEKARLFEGEACHTIIYAKDYQLIDRHLNKHPDLKDKRLLSWSIQQKADLQVLSIDIQAADKRTHLVALYDDVDLEICIPFIDRAAIENCLLLWLFLLDMSYSNPEIQERFDGLEPVAMRLELKAGVHGCTVINDSYNSDFQSLDIALDLLSRQQQHTYRTVILSDILQSKQDSVTLYREVSQLLQKHQVDHLIGIGADISAHQELFGLIENCNFYPTTDHFLDHYKSHEFRQTAILVKGSRQYRFERISQRLQQKNHRTVLEINLDALIHNLNYYRSLLDSETRIMVMVKALAYGSGSYEVANVLQFNRVDYLGVAYVDEGVALREAGISLPIMVMNPEPESFPVLLEHRLEPEIYKAEDLIDYADAVRQAGLKAQPVHLKVDTGMHRLGFSLDALDWLVETIEQHGDAFFIKSVFSHLAAADNPRHDDYTRNQIAEFKNFSEQLALQTGQHFWRHILNSAGIERFSSEQFDMVRLGIGLYGISTLDQSKLEPISSLKTRISQIKQLKAGESVGYDRSWCLDHDAIIGVIAIGYADGFNRRLSNGRGKVLINGYLAPVVGNVCMDMCMVDITGIEAEEGDEVIIFGKELPISDLAKQLATIPYEIMTSISARVKKIYFQE